MAHEIATRTAVKAVVRGKHLELDHEPGLPDGLDTDICSAYLKGDRRVMSRFMQYAGGVHISGVTRQP